MLQDRVYQQWLHSGTVRAELRKCWSFHPTPNFPFNQNQGQKCYKLNSRLSHPKGYKRLQQEHQQNMQRLICGSGKGRISSQLGYVKAPGGCSSQMENYWAKKWEIKVAAEGSWLTEPWCCCSTRGRQAGRLSWNNHILLLGELQRCQSSLKQAVWRWQTIKHKKNRMTGGSYWMKGGEKKKKSAIKVSKHTNQCG